MKRIADAIRSIENITLPADVEYSPDLDEKSNDQTKFSPSEIADLLQKYAVAIEDINNSLGQLAVFLNNKISPIVLDSENNQYNGVLFEKNGNIIQTIILEKNSVTKNYILNINTNYKIDGDSINYLTNVIGITNLSKIDDNSLQIDFNSSVRTENQPSFIAIPVKVLADNSPEILIYQIEVR